MSLGVFIDFFCIIGLFPSNFFRGYHVTISPVSDSNNLALK